MDRETRSLWDRTSVARFMMRAEVPDSTPLKPAPSALASLVLETLDPPARRIRFDSHPTEGAARSASSSSSDRGASALEVAGYEHGTWKAAPGYAVFAEWQVADPARATAFETSRRELFALRREHLPTFAVDWLLRHLDVPGRYLVLGLYGDEDGARRLCRLHPAIQAYAQAHPPATYGATDVSGLICCRVGLQAGESIDGRHGRIAHRPALM